MGVWGREERFRAAGVDAYRCVAQGCWDVLAADLRYFVYAG